MPTKTLPRADGLPSDTSPAQLAPSTGPLWGRWLFVAAICVGGTILDLWSKSAVFAALGFPPSDPKWIVEGYFALETALNPGAVFGIGRGKSHLFAAFSVIAAVGILVWLIRYKAIYSWFLSTALGGILAGIFGNLYDRLGMWYEPQMPSEFKGTVRDWILWQVNDEWRWPNFNIADSLLVTGAIMLMVHSFFAQPEPEASDKSTEKPTEQSPS